MPLEARNLYLRLLRGWNERDAAEMADCFSADGLMIGFDGSLADGRESIRDHLAPIFADHPTARYVAIIRSVRESGSSQIVLADVGMVASGATEPNPDAMARHTAVANESTGAWRISLFQNTPTALHWDDAVREALAAELRAAYLERGPLPE